MLDSSQVCKGDFVTETMTELLIAALISFTDRELTGLLAQSCETWLDNRMQPRPINGITLLWINDQPIDFLAGVGKICAISRGGVTNDVKDFAQSLGLFGIVCRWADDVGRTYVASSN